MLVLKCFVIVTVDNEYAQRVWRYNTFPVYRRFYTLCSDLVRGRACVCMLSLVPLPSCAVRDKYLPPYPAFSCNPSGLAVWVDVCSPPSSLLWVSVSASLKSSHRCSLSTFLLFVVVAVVVVVVVETRRLGGRPARGTVTQRRARAAVIDGPRARRRKMRHSLDLQAVGPV